MYCKSLPINKILQLVIKTLHSWSEPAVYSCLTMNKWITRFSFAVSIPHYYLSLSGQSVVIEGEMRSLVVVQVMNAMVISLSLNFKCRSTQKSKLGLIHPFPYLVKFLFYEIHSTLGINLLFIVYNTKMLSSLYK